MKMYEFLSRCQLLRWVLLHKECDGCVYDAVYSSFDFTYEVSGSNTTNK